MKHESKKRLRLPSEENSRKLSPRNESGKSSESIDFNCSPPNLPQRPRLKPNSHWNDSRSRSDPPKRTEMKDSDEESLPSLDTIYDSPQRPSSSQQAEMRSPTRKSTSHKLERPLEKGMIVLAHYLREVGAHPARVLSHQIRDGSATYEVEFWDGVKARIPRSRIITTSDVEFKTVEISDSVTRYLNGEIICEDEELVSDLNLLLPQLRRLYEGREQDNDRYRDFVRGGKHRANLAFKSGSGGFSKSQVNSILKFLEKNICIQKNHESDIEGGSDIGSEPGSLQNSIFLSSVILPETIVRLIMMRNNCDKLEAETKLSTELYWVDMILSEHELQRDL